MNLLGKNCPPGAAGAYGKPSLLANTHNIWKFSIWSLKAILLQPPRSSNCFLWGNKNAHPAPPLSAVSSPHLHHRVWAHAAPARLPPPLCWRLRRGWEALFLLLLLLAPVDAAPALLWLPPWQVGVGAGLAWAADTSKSNFMVERT
eukprot:EG_transcript_35479